MMPRQVPPLNTLEPQLVLLLSERLFETPQPFDATTDLYSLGMDSMAIMQLLIIIEEEYGVALPECGLTRQNFTTVRQLAHLILAQNRTAAK